MDAQISRALIASPFESSRARFSALLRESGVRDMQFSDDGRETLKRVSERTIDLLIVDSVLPYLDGATLAEHVLHLKLGVYPGVIMLTDAGMRVRVPEENCVLIDRNAGFAGASKRDSAITSGGQSRFRRQSKKDPRSFEKRRRARALRTRLSPSRDWDDLVGRAACPLAEAPGVSHDCGGVRRGRAPCGKRDSPFD